MQQNQQGASDLQSLAGRYANLSYRVEFEEDTCDGQPCVVAKHPELLGCTAHGATREEALRSLREVRREYIELLLENQVEVPLPQPRVFLDGALLANFQGFS